MSFSIEIRVENEDTGEVVRRWIVDHYDSEPEAVEWAENICEREHDMTGVTPGEVTA